MAFLVIYALMVSAFLVACVRGVYGVIKHVRDTRHRRAVVRPITAAAMNLLRSRDIRVDIPRDIVGTSVPTVNAGTIRLPVDWAGADGDRDNLRDMLSERLDTTISCSYDMSGRTPTVSLSVPKQPPANVPWDIALDNWNAERPYLGHGAAGAVHWDRGEDSPHIGVLGGSGSGKSELMAWIVAQIMRGGGGVVVLDPKATSHRWLMNRPGVLYCGERAMLHDTIIWLDDELSRRTTKNRAAARDLEFDQIVVLLEERNSIQDLLRDHWYDIKEPSQRAKSPALVALDRLNSMGRSLGITVILAGQESASQHIGSRSNYGSFAMAGRMAANHWKNVGVARKPAISAKPGRMAYIVAGGADVFQAAYVDVKHNPDRLWEWASSGVPMLDVQGAMQTGGVVAMFPVANPLRNQGTEEVVSPVESGTSPSSEGATPTLVTLKEYAESHPTRTQTALEKARDRRATTGFPEPLETRKGCAHRYSREELDAWAA